MQRDGAAGVVRAGGGGEGVRIAGFEAALLAGWMLIVACEANSLRSTEVRGDGGELGGGAVSSAAMADEYKSLRLAMVERQIEARGIADARVLAAMRRVPRHEFVPESWHDAAYEDRPLPIGHSQTISQPFIVAAMTELARISPGSRVLEVGTGSGYQAAVVHEVAGSVYTIEIIEPLVERASKTLGRLGYTAAQVRHGDGYRGWPEEAPFDAIIVTAAPVEVPQPLLDQLVMGGRLVIPVGDWYQQLEVHTKTPDGIAVERVFPVRFVPMTGEVLDPRRDTGAEATDDER
jgi:protein-L-isoaspartate(D-aspartate) O-methyltransferase